MQGRALCKETGPFSCHQEDLTFLYRSNMVFSPLVYEEDIGGGMQKKKSSFLLYQSSAPGVSGVAILNIYVLDMRVLRAYNHQPKREFTYL